MANNKTGFVFYSIDTDRYQDVRIRRLKKDFGCNGIAVYDYILCEIYRVRGCFLVWDESTAFDVAEYFGLKESTVKEIVGYCGVVGLFDKGLLSGGNIITSRSIQSRFIEMCKRAKRQKIEIPKKIILVTEETNILPEESDIITEESPNRKYSIESIESSTTHVGEHSGQNNPVPPPTQSTFNLSESNLYRKPRIPTKQDVWEFFSRQGATREMAKKFYEKHDGVNWYSQGSPIGKWELFASNFIENWRKNEQKNEPTANNTTAIRKEVSQWDKQMERQRKRLEQQERP